MNLFALGKTLGKKQPIFVVGLPRSGTTWLASVLGTSAVVKHFHEPFNKDHVPEAVPHWLKYLRADDIDSEYARFCDAIFSGRSHQGYIKSKLQQPYCRLRGRLSWLPGRVMVKDVHACMGLDWIDQHISPRIVVIVRHPCGLAASWSRTFNSSSGASGRGRALTRLLSQPKLIEDHLSPFEDNLRDSDNFFQNVALYWGATYYVLHQQRKTHPDWIFVRHEDLCEDPVASYRKLFEQLQLQWTARTDEILKTSTVADSGQAYSPVRVSKKEPGKWKKELTPQQIEIVEKNASLFHLPYYAVPQKAVI